MSIELLTAFIAACALLSVFPGPNWSLFMANGTKYGIRAALTTVAGTTTGNALLVGIAIAGMSAAITILAEWFDWVRLAGAAYLVWIGYKHLRSAFRPEDDTSEIPVARRRWYLQGLAVSLSNPKVLLFLGAFFPQFLDPAGRFSAPLQLVILGATFMIVTTTIDAAFAFAAGSAQIWFTKKRKQTANGISGILLMAGGVWLATVRRS
ncbi:MAG TPA: LysE family translocator [Hyphomicrobiales bacterium]|nr:LysE family translocator [Hyphomicrobiales bacterium]